MDDRFDHFKEKAHIQFQNFLRKLIKGRIGHFMGYARQMIKDQVVLEAQAQMSAQGLRYDQLPAKINVKFLYEEEPITFCIDDRVKTKGKLDQDKLRTQYDLLSTDISKFIGQLNLAVNMLTYHHEDNFDEQRLGL